MKQLFFSIIILLLLGACEKENTNPSAGISWNYLGLDGHVVNKIQLHQNRIYAATDQGFYAIDRNSQNQNWELLGFEDKICQSFIIVDQDEIIVSLVNRVDMDETGIFKTTNGGESWTALGSFGSEDGHEPAFDISMHPDDPSTLYGVGYNVVARSGDGGESWEPIYGEWQGFASGMDFVFPNPHQPEELWAGGQNAIEQGMLLHSPDGGENWQQWLDLVEAPSVPKDIAFHPTNADEIYVGFEGGLIKTGDNGEEWETLIQDDESRFFFGISIPQATPETVYTAGWLKRFDDPQPFIIYRSKDGGENWQEHTNDEVDFGGVYDMDLISEGGKDKLYIGLYKGGVYEVVFNK